MFIFKLMPGRIVMTLAAVSLLVAIACVVFWIRSYGSFDSVTYSNMERGHLLVSAPGTIVFSTWNHLPQNDFTWEWNSGTRGVDPLPAYEGGDAVTRRPESPAKVGGFRWETGQATVVKNGSPPFVQRYLHAAMPFWVIVLLFLIGPAWWVATLVKRYRRARTGRCIYCNAIMPTPEQCPACGTEFDGWAL